MREHAPQYTLEPSKRSRNHTRSVDSEEIQSVGNTSDGTNPCDIVLRLSAPTKNKVDGGFYFGRNKARCDIVVGHEDQIKRVSNIHFRIYINEHGTVMFEDLSTNGTQVDGHVLRSKAKENGWASTIVLNHGVVISLAIVQGGADDFRFIVLLPQREGHSQAIFDDNLEKYLERYSNGRNGPKSREYIAQTPTKVPTKGLPVSSIHDRKFYVR